MYDDALPQCDGCPRKAASLTGICRGQIGSSRYHCRGVAEERMDVIADVMAWQPPPPLVSYGEVQARAAPVAPPIEVAHLRASIRDTVSKFARMTRCPHWQKATDCGCGINRCALGWGDRGKVSHKDCFECPDLPPAT